MFLVRIRVEDVEDWKVFQGLTDAEARFYQAQREKYEKEIDDAEIVLFQVPDETDVRRALERAKAGDALILQTTKWTPTEEEKASVDRILARVGIARPPDEPA